MASWSSWRTPRPSRANAPDRDVGCRLILDISPIIFTIIHMRSTLILDDHLFKKLRQRAASLGTTVSEVVNQALREALSKPVTKPTNFKMVTFGDATDAHQHEPADFAEAVEGDDVHSLAG